MDVWSCNKGNNNDNETRNEKHQMNLQKGAGGQKFH